MSSSGSRERSLPCIGRVVLSEPFGSDVRWKDITIRTGKQKTVSESHPVNRNTGSYDAGGPFFTSRVEYHLGDSHIENAYNWSYQSYMSGPVRTPFPSSGEMSDIGFQNTGLAYGSSNEKSMAVDGTNAISYASPTNPVSNLGTTLAETFREGVPSLPGIQSWKRRTEAAKAAGSEYLNYQFGWAPLVDEVHSVGNTARHHRSLMKQYEKGAGRDTHRTFRYPSQTVNKGEVRGAAYPLASGFDSSWTNINVPAPQRSISLVRETRRWFEGMFTYALPSSTDSWRKADGFGQEAEHLFGLSLTPDVLWELTPWSWAVDWFSNAGEVINNVTNFGTAGLVMRYGYQMEETIETVTAESGSMGFARPVDRSRPNGPYESIYAAPCTSSIICTTKRRLPASPFGFSVGWEGLSPTQLAITAALGITRLL
ncbi:TPA_asm: maturation protein [ssRNA phage Zoerhiza.4_9]|uniref:Maturation protein n=2 Tax=Leviviricetes TaxID=2842243 RepID=A0A8S5L0V5_9VIRU|nr:maturation protein [ssRNA phage Zoerhiza.4_9]QDH90072.1 MAG: hypothetical protein H4Rhizo43445_000004 [Leviviridae sp.]DAD51265.1 TPA_asm: maturation protein [ssRNA phage Zoerhiza.4_9]